MTGIRRHPSKKRIPQKRLKSKGSNKEYALTMNDTDAEKLKAENVEAIHQNIDELKQKNDEALVIEGIETPLQEIEETCCLRLESKGIRRNN